MRKLAKGLAWFCVWVTLSWFVVVPAFFMASHAETVLEQAEADGFEIPWQFRAPIYVAGAVGIVSDVAFNTSYGSVAFWENPIRTILFEREFMFTARVTRHLSSGGWRQKKAEEWCTLLDRVDRGHCDNFAP